jgi:uncharacterized damage-inducible protein DinB
LLWKHWLGHRRVTRRVIEAFPEDKLFSFAVGSMRPFAAMVIELLLMEEPIVRGVAREDWSRGQLAVVQTKEELLARWDEATSAIEAIWPTIPLHRFSELDKAFGIWEGEGIVSILYAIENEIHHRGQGYVYLRALGITPPAFADRT